MKRMLGFLGWLGVVLVVAAVVAPVRQAGTVGVVAGPGARGPRRHAALHAQPVARHRPIVRAAATSRYGSIAAGSVCCSSACSSPSTTSRTARTSGGISPAAQQFSLSDQTKKISGDLKKPVTVKVFYETGRRSAQPATSSIGYDASVELEVHRRVRRRGQEPGAARKQDSVQQLRHGRHSTTTAARSATTHARRAGLHQRAERSWSRARRRRCTSSRATASTTRRAPIARRLQPAPSRRSRATTSKSRKLALAQEGKVPDDATVRDRRRAADRLPRAGSGRARAYLTKGGKLLLMIDPPAKPDRRAAHEPHRAREGMGHRRRQRLSWST